MKKEKIFANNITDKIGNNQSSCIVDKNDELGIINEEKIDDKLNRLFNTNGYIFNVDVKIITLDKTYNTKIASRVGNNLITLDNDIINIDDIKDIVF